MCCLRLSVMETDAGTAVEGRQLEEIFREEKQTLEAAVGSRKPHRQQFHKGLATSSTEGRRSLAPASEKGNQSRRLRVTRPLGPVVPFWQDRSKDARKDSLGGKTKEGCSTDTQQVCTSGAHGTCPTRHGQRDPVASADLTALAVPCPLHN